MMASKSVGKPAAQSIKNISGRILNGGRRHVYPATTGSSELEKWPLGSRRKSGHGAAFAARNDDDAGLDCGAIKDGHPNPPVPSIVLAWADQIKIA
jgi:hypothetical protein